MSKGKKRSRKSHLRFARESKRLKKELVEGRAEHLHQESGTGTSIISTSRAKLVKDDEPPFTQEKFSEGYR